MTDIQYLVDRLAISDLQAEYADYIDSKQFHKLPNVFTEDAYIDYTAFGGSAGNVSEIIEFLNNSMASFSTTQHMMGNSIVRIEDDTAHVRTQCHNPMVVAGDQIPQHVIFLGLWYVDELKKTSKGWRIHRRHQDPCYAHNMPEDFVVNN
jgi:hypothetical protein